VTPPETRGRLVALTVTALVAVFACLLLGAWQLGRVDRPVDGYSAEPTTVPLDRLVPVGSTVPAADVARQVLVTGSYDGGAQRLEPGHTVGGQPVDWVVTPLVLPDATRLLVVRGWVTGSGQSLAVPPTGSVSVTGRLEQGPSAGAGGARFRDGYVVRTAQSPPDPLSLQPVPVPPPHNDAPDEVHVQNAIYVVQWWFFAAIMLVSWWRLVRANGQAAGATMVSGVHP
jgi:cytochrome oxidase assembly protein ShyY1